MEQRMPTTVGSAEALLHLLITFQEYSTSPIKPTALWATIRRFMDDRVNQNRVLNQYTLSNHSKRPAAQFIADLSELVDAGFLVQDSDGRLIVTPVGRAYSTGKSLPTDLKPLEDVVIENARASA